LTRAHLYLLRDLQRAAIAQYSNAKERNQNLGLGEPEP